MIQLRAFKLLYSSVMFQLHSGENDALSILSELNSLYDLTFGDNQDEKSSTSEMLVELLLGLVSKTSLWLRKLAQQVFTAFASQIRLEGLQLLFDVSVFQLGFHYGSIM